MKLVLNVTSKHANINVELDEHALNRLNDAVPGALLTVWPLVQQVVRVVQEKQEAESNEEDSDEEAELNVGRRWIVVGQSSRQSWMRLSMPFESLEDAEQQLANEQFRKDCSLIVNTLRVITEDEWEVCFSPEQAPPGIAAVLCEVFHERPIWMVLQWLPDGDQIPRTFRWVPRAISYNLGSMYAEKLRIENASPATAITAVCSYPNWLHSFRERDSVYLAPEGGPHDAEFEIWWDESRGKWTLEPGAAESKGWVTQDSWRGIYHYGYACPPERAGQL